ncbi:hypothetical protein B0H17DRAFT_1155078 [Mycena rosella]|uniref:Uncharacterized protein n=1 Tax=Mycena rosella TaxID=1033263 RepID=A0AAD7AX11_MYCRO|nr:hypothetical protein B0H17DRAFT_1155078 [Mycena rosella]
MPSTAETRTPDGNQTVTDHRETSNWCASIGYGLSMPEYESGSSETKNRELRTLRNRHILFGCFLANARGYAKARESVRTACRDWMELVDELPGAWSAVYVCLETSIDTMDKHFDNAKHFKLTVQFDFSDHRYLSTNTWTQHNFLPIISASFEQLAVSPERCTRLTVRSCLRTATSTIESYVSHLKLPALQILNIHFLFIRPEEPQATTNLVVTHSSPSIALAGLIELKLQGLFPRWRNGQPYNGLSWLSLHMMRGSTAMTWAEARALFVAASRLIGLRLDQVECTNFLTTPERLPTLWYLKKFALSVSHHSSVRMARAIDMPAVKWLTLTARADDNVYHIIIENLQAMEQATHLTLNIQCRETSTLRSLLCKFPRLTHLDYTSNNARMVELLASTAAAALPKQLAHMKSMPPAGGNSGKQRATKISTTDLLTRRSKAFFSRRLKVFVGV